MKPNIDPRSFRLDLLLAFVAAAFVAAVGRSISLLALWLGGPEDLAHMLDDVFTGVIAGIVALIALRNVAAKRRLVKERLREIVETNHHIRNAIDVIGSSHLAPTEASRLEMIADSVARIDQTLKEFNVADGGSTTGTSNGFGAAEKRRESYRVSSTKFSRDV